MTGDRLISACEHLLEMSRMAKDKTAEIPDAVKQNGSGGQIGPGASAPVEAAIGRHRSPTQGHPGGRKDNVKALTSTATSRRGRQGPGQTQQTTSRR